jgi:hypothetical protein
MPVRIITLRESRRADWRVNEDYRDFIAALLAARARFLVVGAYALAAHGVPRATVDLDV